MSYDKTIRHGVLYDQGAQRDKVFGAFQDFIEATKNDPQKAWNNIITPEAANLLSKGVFFVWLRDGLDFGPFIKKGLEIYKKLGHYVPFDSDFVVQSIGKLFDEINKSGGKFDADYSWDKLNTLVQKTLYKIFFQALASSFEQLGYYKIRVEDCNVIIDNDTNSALLFESNPHSSFFFMPFLKLIKDGEEQFIVDFEALCLFVGFRPSVMLDLAEKEFWGEQGQRESAIVYARLAESLANPYERLNNLVLENPIICQFINDQRAALLKDERMYIELAKKFLSGLNGLTINQPKIPEDEFFEKFFKKYDKISGQTITDADRKKLDDMNDDQLRKAFVEIINANPEYLREQANKPHHGHEGADMKVSFVWNDSYYYVNMPFKSGQEIKGKGKKVTAHYLYQIFQALFPAGERIVIFVTAKPCTEPMRANVEVLRTHFNTLVTIIEGDRLAKLLKANGKL